MYNPTQYIILTNSFKEETSFINNKFKNILSKGSNSEPDNETDILKVLQEIFAKTF